MRFESITALCVTPLALAASLQVDLAARGIVSESPDLTVKGSQMGGPGSNAQNNYQSNGGNNNGGNNVVINNIIEENTVVVLWSNQGGGAQTETVTRTVTQTVNGGQIQTSTISTASGSGQTHQVMVGGEKLVYNPPTIQAAIGDSVIFTFMATNHTVTQSGFLTPCEKMNGGVDSGFMANANNTVSPPPQFAMQVMTTGPTWFYCRQTGHCGKGMVFSINPNVNKTQLMFAQMAVAQNGTGTPTAIQGGSAAPPPPAGSSTVVAPPPAGSSIVAAPPSQNSGSMVSGTGSMVNGVLTCSCLCAAGSFPNAGVQGIGMLGGMSGSMPRSAMQSI